MAKKKNKKKTSNDNYSKFCNVFSMSATDIEKINKVSPANRENLFYCHTIAQFSEFIQLVECSDYEKTKMIEAVKKHEPIQILKVIIVFIATMPKTAKDVFDIINNIHTYIVSPFTTSYYEVGKWWFDSLMENDSGKPFMPIKLLDYTSIGEKLHKAGYVQLTPFGAVWNVRGC